LLAHGGGLLIQDADLLLLRAKQHEPSEREHEDARDGDHDDERVLLLEAHVLLHDGAPEVVVVAPGCGTTGAGAGAPFTPALIVNETTPFATLDVASVTPVRSGTSAIRESRRATSAYEYVIPVSWRPLVDAGPAPGCVSPRVLSWMWLGRTSENSRRILSHAMRVESAFDTAASRGCLSRATTGGGGVTCGSFGGSGVEG